MKSIAIGLLGCWTVFQACAAEPHWLTDLAAAQKQAKAEHKLVFMEFTGSDWCPPCKALHANVLTNPAFLNFAATNLVLVVVDFPRTTPQSNELKKNSETLARKFNVEAFPTVIVLDEHGKQLKRAEGYGGQGAGEFVADLKKLKT